MLTQTYLHSVFTYRDGQLYWLGKRRGAKKDTPVGSNSGIGYVGCMLDGKHYLLHRLVYLYSHGCMPKYIDHINGDKKDNQISNLRSVTNFENQQNMRKAYSTNKSGLIGAFYSSIYKNWFSRICVNGKRKWLGCFKTPEEAHQAYLRAKRELHPTCTI